MPSTVLDSDIFKDMFGSAEMRAVFSDDNLLTCCVDAEVALAVAQGRLGVIPQDAADAIARLAPSVAINRAELKQVAENVGYPILGLVRQLSQSSAKRAATCTGARPRRTSWTPPRCCKFAPRSPSSSVTWQLFRPRCPARGKASRHRHARPHTPATGAADHVRLQMRDLASMMDRAIRRSPACPAAAPYCSQVLDFAAAARGNVGQQRRSIRCRCQRPRSARRCARPDRPCRDIPFVLVGFAVGQQHHTRAAALWRARQLAQAGRAARPILVPPSSRIPFTRRMMLYGCRRAVTGRSRRLRG